MKVPRNSQKAEAPMYAITIFTKSLSVSSFIFLLLLLVNACNSEVKQNVEEKTSTNNFLTEEEKEILKKIVEKVERKKN